MLDGVGHRKHQKNEDERAAQAEDAIIGQQAVARNWTQVAKVLGTCVVSQDLRELYFRRRCRGPGSLEVYGTGLCCNMGHGCDGCESGDFGGEVFFLLADALEFTGGGIGGDTEGDTMLRSCLTPQKQMLLCFYRLLLDVTRSVDCI